MSEQVFKVALEYYIYSEHGTKEEFEQEILEYGEDYCAFYYDTSFNDLNYQASKNKTNTKS